MEQCQRDLTALAGWEKLVTIQDYMRELNSVKAEELMKTKEFLLFKDRLIEYLQSFVKSLQVNTTPIEQKIRTVKQETIENILKQVTAYKLKIPRIDVEWTRR